MRPTTFVALAAALGACAPRTLANAQEVPPRWGAYSVEVVDASGRALPTFGHRGRSYVLGTAGQRYLLRIRNGSDRRVEVVASVDGRDVMDGRPASLRKRGYVIAPYGELTIDGYRLSEAAVAAFRFSSVPRSYASRMGDARDVGVVGVAVFPERWQAHAPPVPHPGPEPVPREEAPPPGGATAPRDGSGASDGRPQASAEAPAGARADRGGDRGSSRRPGLGTEFGEQHASPVEQVMFERASPHPEAVLTLRYDDRAGLVALGIDVDSDRWARRDERWLRETATPFRSERGYSEPPPGWRAR
jgi:hypothetical protein